MPDLPLTILVSVCLVTPRIFAPSVTDNPKSFSLKSENNAPVRPDRHGPETAKLALERMQAIAGEAERLRCRGLIETARNVFHVFQQIRAYSAPVVAFKKAFQARCLKLLIIGVPQSNTCRLSSYSLHYRGCRRKTTMKNSRFIQQSWHPRPRIFYYLAHLQ
jgi:hypothetical protein